MLKSYSHDNYRKGRYVKATKCPFLSLIDSQGLARSVSGSVWTWTDADPKRACAFMVCVCRTQVLAMARPAVGFLSMPRGLLQPVPMAALLAWAGRLCPRDL